MYWDIRLLQAYITRLDLDRRLLLQELPSLEELAKIIGAPRHFITIINEDVDDFDREIADEYGIQRFTIIVDLENEDTFRRLVNLFRHYCLAKTLVELGYTTVSRDVVNSIMLEFPLYDPEYCRDEVRYVYERLRREGSPLLKALSRYPICESSSPLDVLAHMVLDLNLIGARGVINEFFLNFTSKPVSSVRNLLASHLLLLSLPAVSLGSLLKLSPMIMSLLTKTRVSLLYTEVGKISPALCDIETYRELIRKVLNILEKSSDVLMLPKLLKQLQICEEEARKTRSLRAKYTYYIVLLSPPRSRSTVGHYRHINNLGLLIKTMMIV